MQREFDTAIALQSELLDLTTALAEKIAVPATARDGAAVQRDWQRITLYRSRLNSLYRALRKFSPQPRRSLSRSEQNVQNRRLREIKALRQRLAYWPLMEDLVARHADPEEQSLDLFPAPSRRDDMVMRLAKALHLLANSYEQAESSRDHGCFADIPFPMHHFEELLRIAYRLHLVQGRASSARFLDVGCGGGTKVFAAQKFFRTCHGLEYDPDYAKAAQRTLSLIAPECRITQGDALEFENYGDYDVIYFYRPLRIDELLKQMELRVLSQCKPGTVILAPYTDTLFPRDGFPAACVTDCVFVAGLTQCEVDKLHADAVFTDTERVTQAKDLPFDAGFWAPLLESASFNGHRPATP